MPENYVMSISLNPNTRQWTASIYSPSQTQPVIERSASNLFAAIQAATSEINPGGEPIFDRHPGVTQEND
jgi:hypothetical protein